MIGSPGSGKTMIARRLPTILPLMTFEEALEVTKFTVLPALCPQILLLSPKDLSEPAPYDIKRRPDRRRKIPKPAK